MRHQPTNSVLWPLGWVVVVGLGVAGCTATGEPECRIGADCPSGACSDGHCVPVDGTGGSAAGGGSVGGGGGSSSGQAGSGGVGAAQTCLPNEDGTILQSEIPVQPGLSAKFLATQNVEVDTAGVTQGDGSRLWDLTGALAGDHLSLVETLALEGTWYDGLFGGASYAARLADSEELLGVYQIAQDAVMLLGVVSPEDGMTRTELTYEPPVKVFDFPLTEGKSWQTTSTVTGVALGVAVFYTEAYDFQIDAHGVVITPYAEFQVLRVHSELTRTVGMMPTTLQSHLFVTECFGTVATMMSQDHELSTEFTSAAEIRRLSP
ncbi:MAG: hypothetical protein JRI68_23270 [Deltaproteobacteria bacterium]|nr:hypothetical protein [Deltaproteobacteria bacterium]